MRLLKPPERDRTHDVRWGSLVGRANDKKIYTLSAKLRKLNMKIQRRHKHSVYQVCGQAVRHFPPNSQPHANPIHKNTHIHIFGYSPRVEQVTPFTHLMLRHQYTTTNIAPTRSFFHTYPNPTIHTNQQMRLARKVANTLQGVFISRVRPLLLSLWMCAYVHSPFELCFGHTDKVNYIPQSTNWHKHSREEEDEEDEDDEDHGERKKI